MEINCPSCYTLIDEEENNCPNCGTTLKKSKPGNLKLIVVLSIIIMLLLTSYLIIIATQRIDEEQRPKGIEIDGNFNDWNNVDAVDDANEVMPFNTNVDILECRVNGSISELSFYLRVEGDVLAGEPDGERHVDTVYIFIDTDQSPDTGYYIEGIGADYMVEVYGWNGEILDKRLFSYTSEQQDWNLWGEVGTVSAAVSGSELEAQVDYDTVGLGDHDTVDVLFYIQSWDGFEDFSDSVLGNEIGVLFVTQQGIGDDVISGFGNRLLRLEIQALNADITIAELRVNRMGGGSDNDISEVRLEEENHLSLGIGSLSNGIVSFLTSPTFLEGQRTTVYIVVDISVSANSGNSIGFRIMNNHDVVTDRGTVSLTRIKPDGNNNEINYVFSVPENITTDGAFADWNGKTIRNDTTMDVNREDLDMLRYGVSFTDTGPAFYLRVNGEIAGGVKVPFWNTRTESDTTMDDDSSRTGEDIIYIFIDTINDNGYNDNLPIGADYLIEVRGRYNQIISSSYYEWSGTNSTDWLWLVHGPVEVGLNTDEMEIGIDWDDIGVDPVNDRFSVYFLITDWEEGALDYSDGEGTIEGPTR